MVQWWSESQARREPLASGEIPGTWLQQWAVTTHLLPALLFLIALGLAWRWPLVGALAFGGVALVVTGAVIISALEFGYLVAVIMHAVTGALFFLDWWLGRRPHCCAQAGDVTASPRPIAIRSAVHRVGWGRWMRG